MRLSTIQRLAVSANVRSHCHLFIRYVDVVATRLRPVTRPVRTRLVAMHSQVCGRGASIRNCGFALAGDCRICDALLDPVTISPG